MSIHAAKIKNSYRLQAILKVLQDGNWYSAREIRESTGNLVEAVSARIQELKANNISIECKYINGQYRYRLISLPRIIENTSLEGSQRLSPGISHPENSKIRDASKGAGETQACNLAGSGAIGPSRSFNDWSHITEKDEEILQESLF